MGFTFVKQSLTDGETKINKALLDPMQDGILAAQERLDIIEDRIEEALYKQISISPSFASMSVVYGTSTDNIIASWKLSKSAKYLRLSFPLDENYNVPTLVKEIIEETDADGTPKKVVQVTTLDGTKIKEGEEGFSNYDSFKLSAGESTWSLGNLKVTKDLTWTLYAVEENGKKQGDEIKYNGDTAYVKSITCTYLKYWGVGNEPESYNADFIKGLGKSSSGTSYGGSYEISSVNDQYIYFAFPKHFGSPSKFDIWENNFPDPFDQIKKVTVDDEGNETSEPLAVELDFYGAKLDYYIYRSRNKLTDTEKFSVKIS